MDSFIISKRSAIMRRVKSVNTSAELRVRSLLHRLGYRFRLHGAGLPGKPDIVLSRHKLVIFVHGCFWHQHRCKRGHRMPAQNRGYWEAKLARNVARFRKQRRALRHMGWRVIVVWECQKMERVKKRLAVSL
jgi:DNA mismatch endonuclease (patch repair protein)